MSVELNEFNEPHLKNACCCAWRAECLPEGVRARLLAGSFRLNVFSRPLAFWQRPLTGVAAAAAVLLAVGGTAFEVAPSSAANISLQAQFASDLVTRHDLCVNSHRSHELNGIPKTDLPRLGHELNRALHEPVLVANLPEPGWQFRGGTVCSVADRPVAHLIFDHAGASVSVFSLPAGAEPTPGGQFEERFADHSIAGFKDGRGCFYFVSSGDDAMTPQHLADLRDRMESDVMTTTWNDSGDRPAVAELLH